MAAAGSIGEGNGMVLSNGTIKIGSYNMNPIRKKPCLCVFDGNTITKYGSFNNQESADMFMRILADFVGAKERETE